MTPSRLLQKGFAAIAAIFLVVVLAAMGTYMVAFSNTQQITSAQDLQGTRAYWAARAGLEWGLAQGAAVSACPALAAPTPINGFSMTVACASTSYQDGPTAVTILQFTSTAQSAGAPGGVGYVERSLTASMER